MIPRREPGGLGKKNIQSRLWKPTKKLVVLFRKLLKARERRLEIGIHREGTF